MPDPSPRESEPSPNSDGFSPFNCGTLTSGDNIMDFDAIVIGSGFGGAIAACRLAEKGYKVLILERGRRWNKNTYPRRPDDAWVWNHLAPERENGWIDLRMFAGMTVAQGAAVGGGSLIYANISCEAPARTFQRG